MSRSRTGPDIAAEPTLLTGAMAEPTRLTRFLAEPTLLTRIVAEPTQLTPPLAEATLLNAPGGQSARHAPLGAEPPGPTALSPENRLVAAAMDMLLMLTPRSSRNPWRSPGHHPAMPRCWH